MKLLKKIWPPRIMHLFQNRALVLLYHRIYEPATDPWKLSVSPAHFEEHLQYLKEHFTVISSKELVQGLKNQTIQNRSVVLTFDDGYLDNYQTAVPLLEKYRLPATFFITDARIRDRTPFWWDELEYIIVHTRHLPEVFSVTFNGEPIHFELGEEAVMNEDVRIKQQNYRALKPPTRRTRLYLELWNRFSHLTSGEQEQFMSRIRNWAGLTPDDTRVEGCMSLEQLKTLSANPLFAIGGHSCNHLSLHDHPADVQEREIVENKQFLTSQLGKETDMFTYPSGNYNEQTIDILKRNGFSAAFTGKSGPITGQTGLFTINRVQINNWDSNRFKEVLSKNFKV